MPASMLARGSNGLRTLYSFAVEGISCISPMAPCGDRAFGLVVRFDLDQRPDQQRVDAVGFGHRGDDLAVGRRLEQPAARGRLLQRVGRRVGGVRLGVRDLVADDLRDQRLVAA